MIEVIAQASEGVTQVVEGGTVSPEWVGVTIIVLVHLVAFAFAFGKMHQRVKDVEEDVKDYARHGERIAAIESRVGLWNMDNINSKSPLTLTEKGMLLLKDSGAEEYIEKNKEALLGHFKDINKPYDIQEEAMMLMGQKLKDNDQVKDYLFHNAKPIKDVVDVAGIALRDIVFKEKDIKIEEEKNVNG